MLARLQVRDFQANRTGVRLNVEVATHVSAGHATRVRRQVDQALHLDQVDLAGVGLDAQLAVLEIAHADTTRVGLNVGVQDRKSTRLNSSHEWISYAVFCL